MDIIVKYVIREPGGASWAETRGSFGKALELRREARNIGLEKAQVYAIHASGNLTGPYREEAP